MIEDTHPNGTRFKYWAAFDEPQVTAAIQVTEALLAEYPDIGDVLGHDDIAPTRKIDVSPAFPMEIFKGLLLGRGESDEGSDDLWKVTASDGLSIREGAPNRNGLRPRTGLGSLPRGTLVEPFERDGLWWHVNVQDKGTDGWVHSRYLQKVR